MKTGTRALSAACTTEVMVIKGAEVVLTCGGLPTVSAREGEAAGVATGAEGPTLMGKRYVHEASGLQVLCVKPGDGQLAVDGTALVEVVAKQLPSSD